MADDLREKTEQFAAEVKEKSEQFAAEVKEKGEQFAADVKEKGGQFAAEAKEKGEYFAAEAKEAAQEVREEATEVFAEAKATFTGETLESAKTVGGAGYREAEQDDKKGPAIASLVLGILSILCAFSTFGNYSPVLGIIAAIVGVVLGAKARKLNQTSLATAGFVTSIIGIVLNGIGFLCLIACAGAIGVAGCAGLFS